VTVPHLIVGEQVLAKLQKEIEIIAPFTYHSKDGVGG